MKLDILSLKNNLKLEGFKHIYEWKDAPLTEYPPHIHKGKVSFYVIEGNIIVKIDGKETNVKEGQRMDVPVGKKHSAKVGNKGCYFIVGEIIKGDS